MILEKIIKSISVKMKKNIGHPFITIVMPVRNESKFIQATLMELIEQDYPKNCYEIIVADGESSDTTREIVKKMARRHNNIRLLNNPGILPSSGRNVGFKNGRGDIFLVIDGHCLINNRLYLQTVVDCYLKSGADCLGRPQPFIIPVYPTVQKAIALARTSTLGHSSNSFIHSNEEGFVSPVSVGFSYKRKVFEQIGYLDETFDACEDVEFNYRVEKAGYKCFFSPKISIQYFPRPDLKGLFKQLMRYGVGRAKFLMKHPETINLDMFLPSLFMLGIVFGPFFSLVHPYFGYFYLTIIGIYLCIISCEATKLGHKDGLQFVSKLLVAFPVIHLTLGLGLLYGFIKYEINRKNVQVNPLSF